MKVYIVANVMSSPNQTLKITELSEMSIQTDFKYKKEFRNRISAVRTLQKKPIYRDTLNFYGIHLAREDQIEAIREASNQADAGLKTIDRSLSSSIMFIPLDLADSKRGELYEAINNTIRYRIIKDTMEKIEKVAKNKAGKLTERSKDALISLIDRLHNINILNDEDITKRIESIKSSIQTGNLEIAQEFDKELSELNNRGAFLEFKED